jgi:hypothetical protein
MIVFLFEALREKMMNRLVKELSTGKHPISFETRTEELEEIKERLNQGFVFVKFIETQERKE